MSPVGPSKLIGVFEVICNTNELTVIAVDGDGKMGKSIIRHLLHPVGWRHTEWNPLETI